MPALDGDDTSEEDAEEPGGEEPIDLETLERLRAELDGLGRAHALESVLRGFLESTPDRVAKIAAGADRGDDKEICQEAHALKGASSTFGAVRLAAVCSALERAGQDGDIEHARALIPRLEDASALTEISLERELGAAGAAGASDHRSEQPPAGDSRSGPAEPV